MRKWEYLVVEIVSPNPRGHPEGDGTRPEARWRVNGGAMKSGDQWYAENIPGELNKLGLEGWELIKIGRGNFNHTAVMYTFKRPMAMDS